MKLIENKEDIMNKKIHYRIYWKESNINKSKRDIWRNQKIWVNTLTTSNDLKGHIYNEINR